MTVSDLAKFIRVRDYQIVKELGEGACGKTVLLYDDLIDKHFVCKKFSPYSEEERYSLFQNFMREVKILYLLYHPNVVRVFNYYMYPDKHIGYILMEFVNGTEIDDYISDSPERINEVFLQALDGFRYLESENVLHRDIRPANLMVGEGNQLTIIDLGFGKIVRDLDDFDKSISLNYWCVPPKDFEDGTYNFCTEVYFVGKLFEMLIMNNNIQHFKYTSILARMCKLDPVEREWTFTDIATMVQEDPFYEIEFTPDERQAYQKFSVAIGHHISKIESSTKYVTDVRTIQFKLEDAYRNVMLEDEIPDSRVVIWCLISGSYRYIRKGFSVSVLRDFVRLLKSCSEEQSRIILANLHARLDAVERFAKPDDDFPF